jgi:NADPH:quinone reductase
MSASHHPSRMCAVIAARPGPAEVLTLADLPVPTPGPEQLLVRVRAAALNRGDLLQRQGEFPAPPGESDILGVEIAGDVVAKGHKALGECGAPVFGLVGGGAYAEYCLLDHQMAIPIPPGFSYVEAASLPEVFFVADTTLFGLGGLTADQSVLIHGGASGLGTACIQMASSVGARVACTVGSADKAARVRALGAELAIAYKTQDFVRAIRVWTSGVGVHLVEDIFGAEYFERNLAVLRDGGCLMQVGVLGGTKVAFDLDAVILKRLQIKGSVMRPLPLDAKRAITARFCERWLPQLLSKALRPVVDSIFPLAEAARAHERMEASSHFGKIILDLRDGGEVIIA